MWSPYSINALFQGIGNAHVNVQRTDLDFTVTAESTDDLLKITTTDGQCVEFNGNERAVGIERVLLHFTVNPIA